MADSRPSFGAALQQLRAAQKSNKGAPLYSVLINRPLGRVFAAAAHVVGLTPNQVTAISAAFTYTGIALIASLRPGIGMAVVITILLVLGYALDASGGQLARLRGGGSLLGEWLDHVIDAGKNTVLHLAVLISFFRFGDNPTWWYAVPLVFCSATIVHFFGFLLTELLARVHYAKRGEALPPRGAPSMLMSALKLPTDYGLLCLVFLLFGWPQVFIWVYLLLALAMTGYTLLVLPRWARRIATLDKEDGR